MFAVVVISPATTTSPVVIKVSHATRDFGSCASIASRMESEIWSAILSGWPMDTDSEVKRCFDMRGFLWLQQSNKVGASINRFIAMYRYLCSGVGKGAFWGGSGLPGVWIPGGASRDGRGGGGPGGERGPRRPGALRGRRGSWASRASRPAPASSPTCPAHRGTPT